MSSAFCSPWRPLDTARPARLLALFEASLDPELTEPRKTAVWFAFASEARSRADYQRICGAQDKKIFAITLQLCDEIIHLGKKQGQMNARAMANAVQGLIDEIWEEILYAGDGYDRDDARFIVPVFLASVFPWAFDLPGTQGQQASLTDHGQVPAHRSRRKRTTERSSGLFDLYRQFYEQNARSTLARKFMGENIRKERSVVFLALDRDRGPGLYPALPRLVLGCTSPIWTLYDLFVMPTARQRGVGRALMEVPRRHGAKSRRQPHRPGDRH